MDDFIRKDPPVFLIDAAVQGKYGGTGVAGDWQSAAELAQQHAFFLAGGLTPHNVTEAVQRVHPWGVDVASGVEKSPGVKDPVKMRDFVQAVLAESARV